MGFGVFSHTCELYPRVCLVQLEGVGAAISRGQKDPKVGIDSRRGGSSLRKAPITPNRAQPAGIQTLSYRFTGSSMRAKPLATRWRRRMRGTFEVSARAGREGELVVHTLEVKLRSLSQDALASSSFIERENLAV